MSGTQPAVVPPQSLQEVESLVTTLYQPGLPPAQLVATQKQLHELQLSPMGWEIGNGLLASSQPNIRFFGALTFNIKFNSQEHTLSVEQKQFLRNSLLHWITYYASNGDDTRVVRKLSTSLALFYLISLDGLDVSVSHLAFTCLGLDASTIDESVNIRTMDRNALQTLSKKALLMIFWFISAFSEEGGKRNSSLTSAQYTKLNQDFSKTMRDIVYLIDFAITEYNAHNNSEDAKSCRTTAMSALSGTKYFYLNVCTPQDGIIGQLKQCLSNTIAWVDTSRNPESVSELVELLGNDRIFDETHYEVIERILTTWGREKLQEEILVDMSLDIDLDDDEGQILPLLLAYTDSRLANLLEEASAVDDSNNIRAQNAKALIEMMQELIQMPGYPEINERISSQALEFWNQWIEYAEELIAEYGDEQEVPDTIEYGKGHIVRLVQQLCIKIKSPTTAEWLEVEKENRQGFRDFRIDCKDTLQSSYRILGSPLFQMFAEISLAKLSENNWFELESALFCLTAIGATDESNDSTLTALFQTLLEKLVAIQGVEQRTLRTMTDLIGISTSFFRRNSGLLPLALNFLFFCLQNNTKPDDAARAINHLCDTNRALLLPQLSTVFQQYDEFIGKPTATQFAIEKLSGAVSFLLQGLPNLSDTIVGAKKLLEYVSRGITQAQQLVGSGQVDEGRELARISLHCLSSIATSLRAPTDMPIDLDATLTPLNDQVIQELRSFQSRVFEIIATVLRVLSEDTEIIEEICSVFKAGFTESSHFPFHFAPDIVDQFFSITTANTTNLEAILRMTCSFVRSQDRTPQPMIDSMSHIIQHLAQLIQETGGPSRDAEITQSLIEVLERTIPNWITLFLQLQPSSQVEAVLNFTILALEVSEPLPKRAAASFWDQFFKLNGGPDQGHRVPVDQALLDQVISHYGPLLAGAFIRQISGNASRLDLPDFAVTLRQFLKRDPRAKEWMEQALVHNVPPEKVDETMRRTFIQRIGLAKDHRSMKEALTQFWSSCMGFSSQYKPL